MTQSTHMVSVFQIVCIFVDVNLLFNYIWTTSRMNMGEAWTPICLPGCSDEFTLHVYTCFRGDNLGMVVVCTDHDPQNLEECSEYRTEVFEYLNMNRFINGPKSPTLYDEINKTTIAMHEVVDYKEILCALISDNEKQQYTQFNFPLVAKANHRY